MKILKFKEINNKKGFTLLFAILVAIMVLAVGASIINISLKQIILSGSGRESQFAFYAANTGMECALFWDLNGVVVDDGGTARYVFPPPESRNLTRDDIETLSCSRTRIYNGESSHTQNYTTEGLDWNHPTITTFRIAVSNNNIGTDNVMYCAEVTVEKEIIDDSGNIRTTIISQGLNTCDPENDQRAVQRGLILQYNS